MNGTRFYHQGRPAKGSALADVLTAPDRSVEVCFVLSEPGATTAAGGPYSFGTTLAVTRPHEWNQCLSPG